MSSSLLISIIVPVYKVEKYLSRCIESILTQTYKNIEVILVDDGSTDSSGSICDKYAEIDKRIVVIHKSNGGVSSARNEGIIAAKGDYLAFIDADDYVANTYLEHLVQHVGFDIVVNSNQKEESEFVGDDIRKYVNSFGRSLYGTSIWAKIYSSKLIKDNKYLFNDAIYFGEDTLFNLEVLRVCQSIKIIPYNEYQYRFIAPARHVLSKEEIIEKIKQLHDAYDKLGHRFNCNYDITYDIKMTISVFSMKEILQNGDDSYFAIYKKYFPDKNINDLYSDPICSPLFRAISIAKDEALLKNSSRVKSILYQATTRYAKEFREVKCYPYAIHNFIGILLGHKLTGLAYITLMLYGSIKKQ